MDREGLLTVAEVSRRTGVTRKALRLYERHGLVEPARSPAGYRLYDEEALRRIDWVLRAKLLGLSFAEARELLHVDEGCCGANHPELAAVVRRKLAQTERRIRELRDLQDTLGGVLGRLEAHGEEEHRCDEALCVCGGRMGKEVNSDATREPRATGTRATGDGPERGVHLRMHRPERGGRGEGRGRAGRGGPL